VCVCMMCLLNLDTVTAFTKPPKVYLIGIDGADWSVINYLLERGDLPNIQWLMDNGCYGDLQTDVADSPITWTSIATGKDMEKHGVNTDLTHNEKHSNNLRIIRTKRIWDILEECGKRVGIYQWYFTSPVREVNGFWVMKDYDEYGDDVKCVYPDEVSRKIKDVSIYDHEMLLSLIDKYDCDFVAAYWDIKPDRLQHFYWLFHVLNIQEDLPPLPTEVISEIKKYADFIYASYRAFDQKIPSLLERLDKDDILIIASDHGFDVSRVLEKNIHLTDSIWDYLKIVEDSSFGYGSEKTFSLRLDGRDDTASFILAIDKEEYMSPVFPNTSLSYQERVKSPVVHFYLNEPNEEKREICKRQIMRSMEGIRFADWSVFHREKDHGDALVYRVSDELKKIYTKQREQLDDLCLEMHVIWGDHFFDDPGIVIAYGGEFKRNHRLSGSHVYDIVPTILHCFDLPVGRDMDGKVLLDAFKASFFRKKSVQFIDTHDTDFVRPEIDQTELPSLSREKLRKLRSLGYI